MIEIPYFIQLTEAVVKWLFGEFVDKKLIKDFSNGFPHGFIHPKSKSFGDFCSKGLAIVDGLFRTAPAEVKWGCFKSLVYRSRYSGVSLDYLNPLLGGDI